MNQKIADEVVLKSGVSVLLKDDELMAEDEWTRERELLAQELLNQDKQIVPAFWQGTSYKWRVIIVSSMRFDVTRSQTRVSTVEKEYIYCANKHLNLYIDKYEREAAKSWNLFYKRNTTHFYKDRFVHMI
jgi:hypothetical protein